MKHKSPKSLVRTREAIPGVNNPGKGSAELTCPFCTPTHSLYPDKPAPCGTIIQVKAVQVVIPQHTVKQKGIKCLKCGESTGEMVQYMNGYIHLIDCQPETKLMAEPPKFSKIAQIVYNLPERVRKYIEPRTGAAKEVQEIDPNGKPTGKVLGHFFYKGA